MAFDQEINGATPATGSVAFWTVIEMLVNAGASILSCGDGNTYDPTGTLITSGASGAGGLGNTNAWVRLGLVSGHELTIQRGASNLVWRVKYSAQAGFSDGTPSATQTPTATDQAIRCGGGTDASPTYFTMFGTDASYKLDGCADSSSGAFWFVPTLISGGAQSGGLVFDPLNQVLSGDTEPTGFVVVAAGATFSSGTLSSTSASATTSGAMGWMDYGLGSATFVACPILTFGGWPNNADKNPRTNKKIIRRCEYQRVASLGGVTGQKGTSTVICWNATSRSNRELYLVGSSYRICYTDVNLPFVSSVVL